MAKKSDDLPVLPKLGDPVIYHGKRASKAAVSSDADYPAIVTKINTTTVNLRVFLDGTGDLSVDHAEAGDGDGQYSVKE